MKTVLIVITVLGKLIAKTIKKYEHHFVNIDKFRIAFQFMQYSFEFNVNTELM